MLNDITSARINDFIFLLNMSDSVFEEFHTALEKSTPRVDIDDLAEEIAKSIGAAPVRSLLATLVGPFVYLDKATEEEDAILSDICAALPSENQKDAERLRTRIQSIFRIRSFAISAKARDIAMEFHSLFGDARILSDVRPIFINSPTTGPQSAIILHTLKIGYYKAPGAQYHEFYASSLNRNDLEQIKSVIDRALVKDEQLRNMVSQGNHFCKEIVA